MYVIFSINTTRDISKLAENFTRLTAREITCNSFEISLLVFMPNITNNHAITYTNWFEKINSSFVAFDFDYQGQEWAYMKLIN